MSPSPTSRAVPCAPHTTKPQHRGPGARFRSSPHGGGTGVPTPAAGTRASSCGGPGGRPKGRGTRPPWTAPAAPEPDKDVERAAVERFNKATRDHEGQASRFFGLTPVRGPDGTRPATYSNQRRRL